MELERKENIYMNVFEELREIFRETFDDDGLEIRPEMTAKDVEDWDSLMQIQLIVAAERRFGIKFTTQEMNSLKNVGDFAALIGGKLK